MSYQPKFIFFDINLNLYLSDERYFCYSWNRIKFWVKSPSQFVYQMKMSRTRVTLNDLTFSAFFWRAFFKRAGIARLKINLLPNFAKLRYSVLYSWRVCQIWKFYPVFTFCNIKRFSSRLLFPKLKSTLLPDPSPLLSSFWGIRA